ncbi:MAG: KEOPS complex subunit Pcc1 [Candidatus Syntropharchaeia archaeon]
MRGCFEIELPNPEIVYYSLLQEKTDSLSNRSRVELDLFEGKLRLSIESKDAVMLRAAINTWLRLVKVSDDILEICGGCRARKRRRA